jgi:hypothetical protein
VIGTLVLLAITGLGVYGIIDGGHQFLVQHSGVPARVKITHCDQRLRSGWDTCTGVQQTGGTERTLTVHGIDIPIYNTVDVHIRGDEAFTDSTASWPTIVGGVLAVCLWPAATVIRRRKNRASPPSRL